MREFDELMDITMSVTGLKKSEILSKQRTQEYVSARIIIAQIMRSRFHVVLDEIAALLHRRDHSSVIHMLKVHRNYTDIKYEKYLQLYSKISMMMDERYLETSILNHDDMRKQEIISTRWRGGVGIVAVGNRLSWIAFIGCAIYKNTRIDAESIKQYGHPLLQREAAPFFHSLESKNYMI